VTATLEDYRWLASASAERWLQLATQAPATNALVQALRKELSPERTHLIVEQAELRRRAKVKFTAAAQMLFTRVGLEQATDEVTAAYKATRFPAGRVADLCCGIGGDLQALAARGPALAVDCDAVTAFLAQHNSAVLASAGQDVRVVCTQVESLSVADCTAWHLDPDRRADGTRSTQLEYFAPGPEVVARLREEQPCGAIKLAPATMVPAAWAASAELEWISRRGECRQLVAWFGGPTAEQGIRRATVLHDASIPTATVTGAPDLPLVMAAHIGNYIYEADAAVLAADLSGALARACNLHAVEPHGGYLTGNAPVAHGALTTFTVREVLPFDRKKLKSYCRAHGLGRLEIKKRGVEVEPSKLQRELAVPGDHAAVILLAKFHGETLAIVATRQICEKVANAAATSYDGPK